MLLSTFKGHDVAIATREKLVLLLQVPLLPAAACR